MIADILERIDFDLQEAIASNYQLKDGLYVRVSDEKVEFFLYKATKNCEHKEQCLRDLEGNVRADMYEWFALRDYVSVYLNSNKAIDPPKKKIHNNNYLTLFVKAKEFTKENLEHFLDRLYDNLLTFRDFTKKQEVEVLESFKEYIIDDERQKEVMKKKELFEKYFDQIEEVVSQSGVKNYVKIFFDEPLERYEKEASIYYALKLYNKIDTVQQIEDSVYGLSDFNMGLNAKKPYLEHKTRGFKLPFMVEKGEIKKHKRLFDYLKTQRVLDFEGANDASGIVVRTHSENDQTIIDEFDIISRKTELRQKFEFKNHLLAKEGREYIENEEIKSVEHLMATINEIFFNNQLRYYGEVYSKLPNELQNLIYLCRDLVKNFERGEEKGLKILAKKYGWLIVRFHLRQNSWLKAVKAANLVLSILEYEGEKMDVAKKLDELNERCANGDLSELSSEDFYILSGQIISYLLTKSKKSDKRADMIEPFLRSGRAKKLKMEIETLFFAYKHEIPLGFKKLNNAIALVMAYEKDRERVKDWMDKLFIGLLAENIFFRKDDA